MRLCLGLAAVAACALAVPVSGAGALAPMTPASTAGAGVYVTPDTAHGVTAATATFTLPTIACKKATDYEWLLPGIWVTDRDGTLTEQVDVNFNCTHGTFAMADVISLHDGTGATATVHVQPGDTVTTALSESATATTGTVTDVTSDQSVQVTGSATTSDHTVFVGDEGPRQFGVTKVPTFSKLTFSAVEVDGQDLSTWSPVRTNLAKGSQVQIKTGLPAADAFTTVFEHN